MYELIQAAEHTYYIDCPAKMGLWVDGSDAYLIDAGGDKDAGKKALKIITAQGWTLQGVINTHSHADHIGGNQQLQKATGCRVYTGGMEADFTRHPLLEPSLLYGGCPHRELHHKFLMAQPSDVTPLDAPSFPAALEIIPLPGHSPDMIGIRTPDNVVFLGDCVSSAATLEKYGVSYLFNVSDFLATLDRVEAMQAALFIPAHAEASADIAPLVRLNRQKVLEIADALPELLAEPLCFDALLQAVFRHFGLSMTVQQHALIGSTIRSYLSYLKDAGRVQLRIEDNLLLWERAV
ncbi:MAG: MBL fold metallo-hydrolase [Christensenellaceae bacterium]|nr:MBL fold metallo-hydrolase [Christensenellaceae bacterium]